ncbi:MAG: hypothetical protein R2792_13040 [Saprospiraceae bacterium]
MKDQIDRHKAEIARLQDEVGQYLQQINTTETDLQLESGKIEKTKEAFERTHKSVLLQLDADIENLHKLL